MDLYLADSINTLIRVTRTIKSSLSPYSSCVHQVAKIYGNHNALNSVPLDLSHLSVLLNFLSRLGD